MIIAVVSSVFIPDLGYLEEGLTRVLAGMGHSVHVYTSFHYPVNFKGNNKTPLPDYQIIELAKGKSAYSITRLPTVIKIRSNIICRGLKKSILTIHPDLVILVGVSDFFPVPIINRSFCSANKVYAFIGQNYDMGHWKRTNSFMKKVQSYFVNRIIKGFIYKRSVAHLGKIIYYTPDTKEIISKILSPKLLSELLKKLVVVPLGYNSDDFYFDQESRIKIRQKHDIEPDKVVVLTVTRVERTKKIIEIIDGLFLSGKMNVIYIIIGFIENRYRREVEELIKSNKLESNIICLPFISNNLLNDYYSAADFGMWLQSSASIQQAMGTGLPVILKSNNTTSMLITEGLNGFYIHDNLNTTVAFALSSYSYNPESRMGIENFNACRFSYQSILNKLLIN